MKKAVFLASLAVMTANVLGMYNTLPADVNGAVQQPITNLKELVNAPTELRIIEVEKTWKLLNVKGKEGNYSSEQDSLWGNELLIDFIKSQPPTVVRKFFSNIKENFNQKDSIIGNFFGAKQYSEARTNGLPDLIKTLTKEQVEDVINTSAVCSEIIERTNLVDSKTILNLLFYSKNKIPVSKEQNQKMCDNVYYDVFCFLEALCTEDPLHYACGKGSGNTVKNLVEHGADINKESNSGKTPLFDACRSRNENLVKYLIEHGADVNKENKNGETPLFSACESGNLNLVKYLIDAGADINKKDQNELTPLFDACESGSSDLVKYLVEHGADVNKEDASGKTLLFPACRSGNLNLVKYLAEHGANINKKSRYGQTLLDVARAYEYDNIVKYLEERSPQLKEKESSFPTIIKDTPETRKSVQPASDMVNVTEPEEIMRDIANSNDAMVIRNFFKKLLSIHNQSLEKFGMHEEIEFNEMMSYESESDEMMSYESESDEMVSDEEDPDDRSSAGLMGEETESYGMTHAENILEKNDVLTEKLTLEYLLSCLSDIRSTLMSENKTSVNPNKFRGNAEVEVKNFLEHAIKKDFSHFKARFMETPLFSACRSGNLNLVKYLVEHGADVNKENKNGETPLFSACESGNLNLVKYLIDAGADINKKDQNELTPLFDACRSGNLNLVKYLVEHGADVNKMDLFRETPVFYACESGNESLVKYLVEHGADVNKKNSYGETPLDIARAKGYGNIVKYLEEKVAAAKGESE